MKHWVILDTLGCIVAAGSSFDLPDEETVQAGETLLATESLLAEEFWLTMRYVDNLWQLRPVLPLPKSTTEGVIFDGYPAGVSISVSCSESGAYLGDTVTDGSAVYTIALPDPGKYSIEVCPPKPWFDPDAWLFEQKDD